MSRRLCLDTSAYSHFQLGEKQAVSLISSAKVVGIPSIVLGELRAGFKLGSRADKNEKELQEFLSNSVVQVLNVDDEASNFYADVVLQLRKSGTPIPTNDIWIAALALREGATILTFDKHFQTIRQAGVHLLHKN